MSPYPAVVLVLLLGVMLAEAAVSTRNEKRLRARGAVEPDDDVYPTMRWAYPVSFVAMAVEGTLAGTPPAAVAGAGVAIMAVAKALKYWAIGSLGQRWSFRVLVVREPLVTAGPYRWVRHPNYLAVVGELAGMALLVGARLTGPAGILLFSLLIWRRIRVEDRALRHFTCS